MAPTLFRVSSGCLRETETGSNPSDSTLAVVVGGTDGSDGPTDAAGGIVDGATWGPGAEDALARADSGTFLAARDALVVTGPTGTNVMDLLVAVKDPA